MRPGGIPERAAAVDRGWFATRSAGGDALGKARHQADDLLLAELVEDLVARALQDAQVAVPLARRSTIGRARATGTSGSSALWT